MKKEDYEALPDTENQVKNYYDIEITRKLVCILQYYIPKYKTIEEIPKEIVNGREIEEIRINPVLNAPTPTIKKSDQIVKKLIYNDNSNKDGHQFLKNLYDFEDSKNCICIGHIENFGAHHPYFIDTKVLFKSESGKKLIGNLIMDVKNLDNEIIKKRDKTHLTKITDRFLRLKNENKEVGVINQTTMLASETEEIANYFKTVMEKKFGKENTDKHFADTHDTLCYATNENQDATYGLLNTEADLAIVVGGYNSSNTSHLVELCERKFPTYFISSADEIESKTKINHFDYPNKKQVGTENFLPSKQHLKIVITSGASCPDSVVDGVIHKLNSFFEGVNSVDEVLNSLKTFI